MVSKPLPSRVWCWCLCSLGEAVWLIAQREPACWIINFLSPLPYFFPLHIFLMVFLLPFCFVPFTHPFHPSFSFLWATFPPIELTTSITHWHLAVLLHAGWLHTWGEFISSHWGFCFWKEELEGEEVDRKRERERGLDYEFEGVY